MSIVSRCFVSVCVGYTMMNYYVHCSRIVFCEIMKVYIIVHGQLSSGKFELINVNSWVLYDVKNLGCLIMVCCLVL